MNILMIAGTRPNFVKLAPLYHRLSQNKSLDVKICHTGQHFDYNMSDVFWNNLEIPKPDFQLNVSGTNVADTIGKTIIELNKVVTSYQLLDLIIVFGDVNATVSGAIVGAQNRIKVAHVEAGLRSFDRDMPEEVNRILTDNVSDYLFVSEESGLINLEHEGFDKEKVHFVGNIMIETLIRTKPKWEKTVLGSTIEAAIASKPIIATFHRPENVDNKENLIKILDILTTLSADRMVIFPLHPRTKKKIADFELTHYLDNSNIMIIEPQGYFEFMKIISNADYVVTDSGGIQEETSFMNIPCVTFRKNTERPVTITLGTNILLSINNPSYKSIVDEHVKSIKSCIRNGIPLWDENVSERIYNQIVK